MEKAQQQVLPVTYWFDPEPASEPYTVTVRFTGRRKDIEGKVQRKDRFVHDEVIQSVIPGSGPISVTALLNDVNPGTWEVTAEVLRQARRQPRQTQASDETAHTHVSQPVPRLWQWWAPSVNDGHDLKTCPTPFALVPGAMPLSWITMVVLGMVLALATEAFVSSRVHLPVWPVLLNTALAIGIGIAGAKIWYMVKHRREHRIDGWCIQGFVTAGSISAVGLFLLGHMSVGTVMDVATPGLLLGLAVGRIGCFFAGCCGGPPTSARWGVWSSDQRVGARRVPTQLMESSYSFVLAVLATVGVLAHGTSGGAYLVAAIAAYTLGREVLLDLRLERRRKLAVVGVSVVTPLAALVLISALVFIVR